MNGYAKIQEGGLLLINGTQRSQEGLPWPSLNIMFTDNSFTAWGRFSPLDIRQQVKDAHRRILKHLDLCHADGIIPHGVLLGGYAPATAGVYHWLRQMRHPVWVAVMGAAPIVEGEKRQFVPVGCRQIFPLIEEPQGSWQDQRKTTFLRLGARPLTEDRREVLDTITPRIIIDKFEEYLLPPSNGVTPSELILYIQDICKEARKTRASILIDGLPTETLLYLVQSTKSNRVQIYFLKTEMPSGGGMPVPIGVSPMPRF